jgi:site-specific DNA-cytosine methylase
MKVISLFDGMACGLQTLKEVGIAVDEYHAFEIDKYAIEIAKKNHPEIIHHGSVVDFDFSIFKSADLLIGGSPCQGFSFAGKQLAFDDPRSKLFFEFVRAKNEIKPKNFLLENVKMKKEYLDIISEQLGVQPVFINSALVSAQSRQRYYWSNLNIEQPEDKFINPQSIMQSLGWAACSSGMPSRVVKIKSKFNCLTATYYKGLRAAGRPGILDDFMLDGDSFESTLNNFRKLTPIECERLQTLPDNYTKGVSNTQRYKMLGNGWTVAVIKHILKGI